MANTWGKRLSPEAGHVALARPERRVDAVRTQLSQTLSREPHVWLTAVKRWEARFGGRELATAMRQHADRPKFLGAAVYLPATASVSTLAGWREESFEDLHPRGSRSGYDAVTDS
jgi:hypothetical protein